MSTTFFRLLEFSEKEASLRAALRGRLASATFDVELPSLRAIPRSPFAYWAREQLRRAFLEWTEPPFDAKCGMGTLDDFRFLRLSWETLGQPRSWVPYVKGGSFGRFYAGVHLLVNWDMAGRQVKTFVEAKVGSASRKIQATSYYFRPGLTWPTRTQGGLSVRAMPAGCIFAVKGSAAFVQEDDETMLLALLSVANSTVYRALVDLQMAFGSYEVGVIQRTPVPNMGEAEREPLAMLGHRAWFLRRLLDTTDETSHAFVLPPGALGYEASPIHLEAGGFNRADIHRELAGIEVEIDDKVFALYGISNEDRVVIEASMSGGAPGAAAADNAEDEASDDDDDSEDDDSESTVELTATTLTTYSWLVGVAFGRFDPRLATRKRAIPSEPEPFDPLPARSPGMWPAGEEPDTVPPDIMVDDPGHDHDIRMLVASAAANTGWPDPEDLRQWLAKEFFPLHIKMYSKSRRKAPIYWQLATPSASYSVWLYIHAFTKDTFFRVQNDYVAPKLAHEQRKLESLQAASQDGQTVADRKQLAQQESLVEELRAFLDEVKRVAPLWNPNLDDGVIINFSLLWRLVPQHKPWQKELKATWDALCAGKYDWAHLAMHLWPEQVVSKCAKDRSLAIAHGLEEAFWVERSDGKWTARKEPTPPMAELVRERTSSAVQDALKQLLNAPAPSGGKSSNKRGKKGAR